MLDHAQENGNYEKLEKVMLCNPENFRVEHSDHIEKYDFVVASGLLSEGHVDSKVFEEMMLCLKPGGYAIFTTRTKYLTSLNY